MEKVVRDGMVAVLYSPDFGAGWYTWNEHKELLFHPKLIEMVENGDRLGITEDVAKEIIGLGEGDYIYTGGNRDLRIGWVPEGTAFTVEEYDGAESIRIIDDLVIIA